ncbi:MAG: helix-turn-helix domain-containing protein [Mediterranea sp.]|jgi:AraC-like DNA-binding protein|nr:helix-turn-helix domain-containing protein [Mediterranea sp.]
MACLAFTVGTYGSIFEYFFLPHLFHILWLLSLFVILCQPISLHCFVHTLLFEESHPLSCVPRHKATILYVLATAILYYGWLQNKDNSTLIVWLLGPYFLLILLYFIHTAKELHNQALKLQLIHPQARPSIERWAAILGLIELFQLITVAIGLFVPFTQQVYWAYVGSILFSLQIVTLIYCFALKEPMSLFELDASPTPPPHKSSPSSLTKENFEQLFRDKKLYTHPEITIEQLADTFTVDTNTLQAFIRATYHTSFTHLLGQCRMEELHRLAALPENRGKSMERLSHDAGFASLRSYYRYKSKWQGGANVSD